MQIFRVNFLIILLNLIFLTSCSTKGSKVSFSDWKSEVKSKAIKSGVNEATFDEAFDKVQPKTKFKKIDQKQYKRKQTFEEYYQNHVNNLRVNKARTLSKKNQEILLEVEKKFDVPKQYILALWGIETDYGRQTGNFYVIESLANLAYNSRRQDFFESELINALMMVDDNIITIDQFNGSWAGATGQCQFIPSSYYKYGFDGNNDGVIDIWNNKDDIFSSIANYLATLNWDPKLPWGYKVKYSENIPDKKDYVNLESLAKNGLIKTNGSEFTDHELNQKVRFINLDNDIYITFKNFDILWDWNHSNYFAATVGKFAEKI